LKASAVAFRYRFWVLAGIFVLGFVVPWDRWADLDGGRTSWLLLAAWVARNGWLSFSGATIAVLLLGTVCAIAAAMIRTWATAYLGGEVVQGAGMQGASVMADGPYRYLRNPLYLGTWLNGLALAMLMPPSGAVFAIVGVTAFLLVLVRGEESFLKAKLGEAYAEYRKLVPRLMPAMRARVKAGAMRPRWAQAFVAEIYLWGVAGSFAALGWRYNAFLLTKCVLISVGVSMVARALTAKSESADVPAG
jgi:protein-S-isoprenylcysteine O-methyltransferase Ste14